MAKENKNTEFLRDGFLEKLKSEKSKYIPDELDRIAEELKGKYVKIHSPNEFLCIFYVKDAYVSRRKQRAFIIKGLKHIIDSNYGIHLNVDFQESVGSEGSIIDGEFDYTTKEEFDSMLLKCKKLSIEQIDVFAK